MRIRRKFIQLTRKTIPYGYESVLQSYLPTGYKEDSYGNYYFTIGDGYSTMFTCHLDTVSSESKNVKHIFDGDMIRTDGKTILGADDKAGMVVILYMIEKKIPGLYYFFVGEEVGCIGSSGLSEDFTKLYPNIKKIVSFDRRGTESVITHQLCGRSCSDEFAKSLSDALNSTNLELKLTPDDTGILTDSAQFVDEVPECTNISVGYYNEHTHSECQDIVYLAKLCRACTLIDWEILPVVRDPSITDYSYYNPYKDYKTYDDYIEEAEMESMKEDKNQVISIGNESEYSEELYTFILDKYGARKKMFISRFWIEEEKKQIYNMLKSQGFNVGRIVWDGNSCYAQEPNKSLDYIGTRNDMLLFISTLDRIPLIHLKDGIHKDEPRVFSVI